MNASTAAEGPALLGRLFGVASALLLAAAVGCGGPETSMTQVWSAGVPAAPAPMRNVLVFAVNMGDASRRTFEDVFAERLAAQGVAPRRSYELFPGELPSREEAQAAAERAAVEGVLVVTNRGTKQVSTYVPGAAYSSGGFWGGYYGGAGGMHTYSPGYVASSEVVSLDVSLWDTRSENGQLVWTASTRTTEPARADEATRSVVDKVVPELIKQGLIPGPRR